MEKNDELIQITDSLLVLIDQYTEFLRNQITINSQLENKTILFLDRLAQLAIQLKMLTQEKQNNCQVSAYLH